MAIIAFRKQKPFRLIGLSLSFGKDSDDKGAIKQLTAVVDA